MELNKIKFSWNKNCKNNVQFMKTKTKTKIKKKQNTKSTVKMLNRIFFSNFFKQNYNFKQELNYFQKKNIRIVVDV